VAGRKTFATNGTKMKNFATNYTNWDEFFFVIIRETCPERSRRIVVEELSRVGTVRADAAHSRREMNHNIRARIAQQAADGVAPR